MLKPEEIKKRIDDSRKSQEWIDARLGRIKKLNEATRTIGQRALGLDDKGPKASGLHEFQFHNHILRNFKELGEAQLTELATATLSQDRRRCSSCARAARTPAFSGGICP